MAGERKAGRRGSESAAERLAAISIAKWKLSPLTMVTEEFGVTPDIFQTEVLENFADSRRIALIPSKGVGKSCLLAWLIWNFYITRPNAKIVITSITGDNLRDGLWAELRKWWKKSEVLQRMCKFGASRIHLRDGDPETWFISARQWSKGASAEEQETTLAGIHEDNCMAVVDILEAVDDLGASVVAVNACETSVDPDHHANLRSEMAEHLQLRFRTGQISLPNDTRETTLVREATTLRFEFDQRGRRKLEDKDRYIARTGISPDHYDSLALAFSDCLALEGAGAASDQLETPRGGLRPGNISAPGPEIDEITGQLLPRRRVRVRISA